MRGIVFRVSIALLTFSVGVANYLLLRPRIRCAFPISRQQSAPADLLSKSNRKYEVREIGVRAAVPGHAVGFLAFVSSDGLSFSRQSKHCDSNEHANLELHSALRKAEVIIRVEPLRDENGKLLGVLAIAKFPARSEYGPFSILWTDGSMFRYVRSSSLENIREFEKDFKLKRCLPYCTD